MARIHDLHVVPSIRGPYRSFRVRSRTRGWNVTRAGRCLSYHRTQKYAVTAGRRVARRTRVDLVIHGLNGRIRSKDSYRNESSAIDTEH